MTLPHSIVSENDVRYDGTFPDPSNKQRNVMKLLYLIRGLPGSGKSTLAKQLCHPSRVFEADDWFIKNGVYTFSADKLFSAHHSCHERVEESMMIAESPIAVANTATRQWEMQPYREMATEYGYQVVELTIKTDLTDAQLAERCVHNVPVETISRMRARWEP